jgi:hypothetical protein
MKATLPNGTVLDGSPEEVREALQFLLGNITTHVSANAGVAGNHVANGSSATVWTLQRAEALWNCLYGDQKKLIQYLLLKGTASVPEIIKHLGMKKGAALAGVRSSLTRNARRVTEYKKANVINWTPGASDHKWYYKIVPEVEVLLRQISEKK